MKHVFRREASEFHHLQLYRQLDVHCADLIGFIADKNIPSLAGYRTDGFSDLLDPIHPLLPEVVLDFHQNKLTTLVKKLDALVF